MFIMTQAFVLSWYGFFLRPQPSKVLSLGAEHPQYLLKSAGVEAVQLFPGMLSTLQDQALRPKFCSWMHAHKSQAGVVCTHLRGEYGPKVGKQVEWKAAFFTDILTVCF